MLKTMLVDLYSMICPNLDLDPNFFTQFIKKFKKCEQYTFKTIWK